MIDYILFVLLVNLYFWSAALLLWLPVFIWDYLTDKFRACWLFDRRHVVALFLGYFTLWFFPVLAYLVAVVMPLVKEAHDWARLLEWAQ